MKHYRVTFHARGLARSESFMVSGLSNAYAPARAFLLVTNGALPARASFKALTPGAVTSFGSNELGVVSVERIN